MKKSLGFSEGMFTRQFRTTGDNKVFDWDKAANLIKEHCKINDFFDCDKIVRAGLMEDWECTSGVIFQDGSIVDEDDTYVFLGSDWATPILDIDGEEHECWKYQDNRDDYWNDSSRKILSN